MNDHVTIEIRAAEGGADARLLVRDQMEIYKKFCIRRSL
jgi:protein subunit release factor A